MSQTRSKWHDNWIKINKWGLRHVHSPGSWPPANKAPEATSSNFLVWIILLEMVSSSSFVCVNCVHADKLVTARSHMETDPKFEGPYKTLSESTTDMHLRQRHVSSHVSSSFPHCLAGHLWHYYFHCFPNWRITIDPIEKHPTRLFGERKGMLQPFECCCERGQTSGCWGPKCWKSC